MSLLIKDLPDLDKPRERFKYFGPKNLSDVDLLAIILRTGKKEVSVRELATFLMQEIGSLTEITNYSIERLSSISGIGEVKAISLLTSLELGRRMSEKNHFDTPKIKSALDVYLLFSAEMEVLSQEKLYAIFLNSKNQMISYKIVFVGTMNQSIVHPRDIFKEAIIANAAKIILIHNHPSGNALPSKEDEIFTLNMEEAGELMSIPVIEHVIIGNQQYYSFYLNDLFKV